MTIVKVTRKYQITIPESVRQMAGLRVGDKVLVEYDERDAVIKIRVLRPVKRTRFKLGRKLTAEEIERAIEEGLSGCVDLRR